MDDKEVMVVVDKVCESAGVQGVDGDAIQKTFAICFTCGKL